MSTTMTFYFSVKNEVHKENGKFLACINPEPEYDHNEMHQSFIKDIKSHGAKDVVFGVVIATKEEAELSSDLGGTESTAREFENEKLFFDWLAGEGWQITEEDEIEKPFIPIQKFGHRKTANWIFAAIKRA